MDRERIIANGWKQGACLHIRDLPTEHQQYLIDEKGWSDDDLLIVVMQSCDVVNSSLEKEPFIELIKAVPSDSYNGQLINAKNPRKLQIEAPQPLGKSHLLLHIHDRIVLDRRFIETTVLNPLCLDGEQLQILKTWLGARYNRASFPDKFMKWANQGISKLRDRLDKQVDREHICKYVEGIYMRVEPDRELDDGGCYDLHCFALISPSTPPKAQEKIQAAMEEFVSKLPEGKISVQTEDSLVMNTAEVTVQEIVEYKRFYFDELSLKRGESL
ncbi:hypothetical protein D6779_02740 [Candidatus Parcubacteria bacterium]|nr:MAG: hypothetical protein D6779_02740 [Candidatus Parcubacteria bacterium]